MAEKNAEIVASYIPPEAYDAAKKCWELENRHIHMQLTWDEQELDEFSLSLRYMIPIGSKEYMSVDVGPIDFPPGMGITCTGPLMEASELGNVVKEVTCRRSVSDTQVNARGQTVRARSTLIVVRTGAGSIPILMPEIPVAGPPADPLPIGTVIDWYMWPNIPIPYGYQICDGSPIVNSHSPLVGQKTPDLIDRFVIGVPPGRNGETGGRADISNDGSHNHGGHAGRLRYLQGEVNWAVIKGEQHEYSHRHDIRDDGEHNHGGENRPPYLGLVKLMKIIPSGEPLAIETSR